MATTTSIRVLCVDDDPSLLRLWSMGLGAAGMRVHSECESESALRAIDTQAFDVVLCDYRMPGLDGIDVLAHARDKQPDAVCVMISAQSDFDMAMQAVNRVGVFRLLAKPVRIHDLREAIHLAAQSSRLYAENRRLTAALAERNAILEQMNAELEARVAAQAMRAVCTLLHTLGLWSEDHQRDATLTTQLALRLSERMGLDAEHRAAIELGAPLHDIGMLAVPRSLLVYPGSLDPDSEEEVRKHVSMGSLLVRGLGLAQDAQRVVEDHHEHWDGSGYPRGLSGEDIYIGARVVAVCDSYVALRSVGPRRNPVSHSMALLDVKQWSGSRFDPSVVTALCGLSHAEAEAALITLQG
ncbi:MAG: response regulator [Deltaproteobacteria bacterium]|nr:response regulator [Deltaproteobacteria bacterium]